MFSKYTDLLPKEVLNQDTPELQKPDEEAVKEVSHASVCVWKNKQVAVRGSYSWHERFHCIKITNHLVHRLPKSNHLNSLYLGCH